MMSYYLMDTAAGSASQQIAADSIRTEGQMEHRTRRLGKATHQSPIAKSIRKLADQYKIFMRNRAAKKELYSLSSRELADLRISREEIEVVVDGPVTVEQASRPFILVRALKSVKVTLSRIERNRRGYQQLMSMDDRQLQDLGLTRGTADAAAHGALTFQRREKPTSIINDNDHRLAA